MNGILNINKPPDYTSFDIVAIVRNYSREKRVGHGGTLDPDASGVLPVCLGQATRIVEYLTDSTKTYHAEVKFGTTTDTCDASGQITGRSDPSGVSREKIISALGPFRGLIEQVPPMYSAVKYQGKRLYELARAGVTVARKNRPAYIYELELLDWQPPVATLQVTCGKGTYIRSLASDLGEALGCGAHLARLVRTRCGIFRIEDALSVSQLKEAFQQGCWQQFVYSFDTVLSHWKALIISNDSAQEIQNGRPINIASPEALTGEEFYRAYTQDGSFLAILRFLPEKSLWQPEKVFHTG